MWRKAHTTTSTLGIDINLQITTRIVSYSITSLRLPSHFILKTGTSSEHRKSRPLSNNITVLLDSFVKPLWSLFNDSSVFPSSKTFYFSCVQQDLILTTRSSPYLLFRFVFYVWNRGTPVIRHNSVLRESPSLYLKLIPRSHKNKTQDRHISTFRTSYFDFY